MRRWEHLPLRAPRSEHEPSAQSSRARWRRAVCRRASRSHEACLSRAMPPFEPTISHFIFKLEQSVLMCCTCVCPGQRMTQIKGLWSTNSHNATCRQASCSWHMAHAHGTWRYWPFRGFSFRASIGPSSCPTLAERNVHDRRKRVMFVERDLKS